MRSCVFSDQKLLRKELESVAQHLEAGAEVLDVCCGTCEFEKDISLNSKLKYTGIDNNPAYKTDYLKFGKGRFVCEDVKVLPFDDNSFEAVFFVNAGHHFNNNDLVSVIKEMKRVSRHYVVYADAVKTNNDPLYMKLLHRMDRGDYFRTSEEIESLLTSDLHIKDKRFVYNGPYMTLIAVTEKFRTKEEVKKEYE